MNIHSGLTAVFEKYGDDYVAYIEEIPGVNTQGATIEEARTNLLEALELTIEVRREIAREEQEGRSIIKEEIKMVA
jgi:predicted RNase H-like HicB family nuclease